jgi:curved DNA-binding protein
MARDYYDVLGVKSNASEKDIRQAYRRLARKYHPDVNRGNKDAESRFKVINEAYQVLSDPDSRPKYDAYGDHWKRAGTQETVTSGSPLSWIFRSSGGSSRSREEGSGPGRLFEDLLGARRGSRTSVEDGFRTGSVEVPLTVTMEEAYRGTTRFVQFRADPMRGTPVRRIEVAVPPGVDTGSRVHIEPKGESGRARPDIYLVVTVAPHQQFQRTGDDLHATVTVPFTDAVLGAEVEVPTVKGSRVALKLPAETQNGRVFRLRGQGMPRLGAPRQHGDLFVTVQVRLPTNLRDEERDLFRRLHQLRLDS